MTKLLSERYLDLVVKKYNPKAIWEDIVFGDIVYISTENWNTMMAGNKSLKRYPSDDYIKKLEPNFVNKTLGKIMDAYENNKVDVKFNDKTFRLNSEWLSKLKGGDETKELEEAVGHLKPAHKEEQENIKTFEGILKILKDVGVYSFNNTVPYAIYSIKNPGVLKYTKSHKLSKENGDLAIIFRTAQLDFKRTDRLKGKNLISDEVNDTANVNDVYYKNGVLKILNDALNAHGLRAWVSPSKSGGAIGVISEINVNEAVGHLKPAHKEEEEGDFKVGDIVKYTGPMSREEYEEKNMSDIEKHGSTYSEYLNDDLKLDIGSTGVILNPKVGTSKLYFNVKFAKNNTVFLLPEEMEVVEGINEAVGHLKPAHKEEVDEMPIDEILDKLKNTWKIKYIYLPIDFSNLTLKQFKFSRDKGDIIMLGSASTMGTPRCFSIGEKINNKLYKDGVLIHLIKNLETIGLKIRLVQAHEIMTQEKLEEEGYDRYTQLGIISRA